MLFSVLLSTLGSILHRLRPSEAFHFRTSAQIAGVAISIGIATLLFGMMFKFLPPASHPLEERLARGSSDGDRV